MIKTKKPKSIEIHTPLDPAEERLEAGIEFRDALSRYTDIDQLRTQREAYRDKLLGDHAMMSVDQRMRDIDYWTKLTARFAGDVRLHLKLLDAGKGLLNDIYGDSDTKSYFATQKRLSDFNAIEDRHPVYYVGRDDKTAIDLMGRLESLGVLYDSEHTTTAPFQSYEENNDLSWKYVPHEDVERYLDGKEFVPTDQMENTSAGVVLVVEDEKGGNGLDVPLSLVVSAAGFGSWRGRSGSSKAYGSKFGYTTSTSIEAMKHYAGLETPLPPVEMMYVYVQPDGRVFADNGSGDSHRIGAAYLRGDKSVKAEKVQFVLLGSNEI